MLSLIQNLEARGLSLNVRPCVMSFIFAFRISLGIVERSIWPRLNSAWPRGDTPRASFPDPWRRPDLHPQQLTQMHFGITSSKEITLTEKPELSPRLTQAVGWPGWGVSQSPHC